MKNKFLLNTLFTALLSFAFFSLCQIFSAQPIFAQITTESQQTVVSATVLDSTAPSIPILIAPENNDILQTTRPEFVWEECTDNVGVAYYQLFLDGQLFIDQIPISNNETNEYRLEFDSIAGEYHLFLKIDLESGEHSWQIRVFDAAANSAESEIWRFLIDTEAWEQLIEPDEAYFILTQIGEVKTLISSLDSNTWPTETIILNENKPLLKARGKPLSTVELILSVPGDPDKTFTSTIDRNGNWSLQLGTLPRGKIITLNFTITDSDGNISKLENVKFIIQTKSIITAPRTVAEEAISEISQEIVEALPKPVQALIESIPKEIKDLVKDLAPLTTAIVALGPPAIATVSFLTQFGSSLSFNLISKLLQALGLIPAGKPQGKVINSITEEGVAFALVRFFREENGDIETLFGTVVTDNRGIYQGIRLPAGKYHLSVSHQDFLFPTKQQRPIYLSIYDYYKGESFKVKSIREGESIFFLVPVDPLKSEAEASKLTKIKIFFTRGIKISDTIIYLMFIVSAVLALTRPGLWNYLMFLIYLALILKKAKKFVKFPDITGVVLDENSQPISNAIVKLISPDGNQVFSIVTSDKKGKFGFSKARGLYQISVSKKNWLWVPETRGMTLSQVDSRLTKQRLILRMKAS
ncbi:MAG: hypothetical protein PVJ09_00015 [Candidatus Woesebacteria bacterium]|jgi:hypothetical protein